MLERINLPKMEKSYYLVENGLQTGPFSLAELKAKKINAEHLVWKIGLVNWVPAKQLSELNDYFAETPPPIPPTAGLSRSAPPIPDVETNDNVNNLPIARRRDRLFAAVIEAIIYSIPVAMIADPQTLDYGDGTEFSFYYFVVAVVMGAILYPMWGCNLGHRIMGLQVVSSKTGQLLLSAKMGAIREGLKSILSFVLIPVIWLLWDGKRQNLYDKLMDTYVVKKNAQP